MQKEKTKIIKLKIKRQFYNRNQWNPEDHSGMLENIHARQLQKCRIKGNFPYL